MSELQEDLFILDKEEKDPEPEVDIAICAECGWRGPVYECDKDIEGGWESGYYYIDLCPKCEDGGNISDYAMSPERAVEWRLWYKRRHKEDSDE